MTTTVTLNRPLMTIGALCGAIGVALAARGSHSAQNDVSIAANFLLLHAPVLIITGLFGARRWTSAAGWVLLAGLVLFAADLCWRSFVGSALFSFAAPIGGVTMILGWLILALSLFAGR